MTEITEAGAYPMCTVPVEMISLIVEELDEICSGISLETGPRSMTKGHRAELVSRLSGQAQWLSRMAMLGSAGGQVPDRDSWRRAAVQDRQRAVREAVSMIGLAEPGEAVITLADLRKLCRKIIAGEVNGNPGEARRMLAWLDDQFGTEADPGA